MISPRLRHRFAAAATVVLLAGAALATVVVHADVDRLAALADVVVDGKVEKRATAFDAAAGAVWTTYDVAVGETLLGAARERVTIHVPGGAVGDIAQEVAGTARLKVGERVVLFLAREDERLLVLGQAQGCFRVERDATSGKLVCRNSLAGLALVGESGERVDAAPTRMRLDALRRRVKGVAAERAAAERRRRAERARKLAVLRARAQRTAERTRGKPGGAQ